MQPCKLNLHVDVRWNQVMGYLIELIMRFDYVGGGGGPASNETITT